MGQAHAGGAKPARDALSRDHGGVCGVSIWSDNRQRAVCTEVFGIHHTYILVNRGTRTKALLLLFVRLPKMPRVVKGLTATEFSSIFREQRAVGKAHHGLALAARGVLSRIWVSVGRPRGGGKCFEFERYFTTNGLSTAFRIFTAFIC